MSAEVGRDLLQSELEGVGGLLRRSHGGLNEQTKQGKNSAEVLQGHG